MSDIRAQSRRDAEFERLADEVVRGLGGMSESEIYDSLRKLHEMGKRHGQEEAKPRWCQACRETGLVHCAHPEDCGNFDEVKP